MWSKANEWCEVCRGYFEDHQHSASKSKKIVIGATDDGFKYATVPSGEAQPAADAQREELAVRDREIARLYNELNALRAGCAQGGKMMPLIQWLEDRRENCLRLAEGLVGDDRKAWMEDAEYFRLASNCIRCDAPQCCPKCCAGIFTPVNREELAYGKPMSSDSHISKGPMSYASIIWNVATDAIAKCHCYGHLCGHCGDARVLLDSVRHTHVRSENGDMCGVCGCDLREGIHVRSKA